VSNYDDQNNILETLDQFLAALARIQSFSVSGELCNISPEQLELWAKVIHASYWVDFAYKHRPELWDYMYEHWSELLPANAPKIPDPNRGLELGGVL
jgi:hypothetical protein